jgi:hypothetical protein
VGPSQHINVTIKKKGCGSGCGTLVVLLFVLGIILAIGVTKILVAGAIILGLAVVGVGVWYLVYKR